MVTEPESARQFLADQGLSQADIAREMGKHRQTLNRYLNGERTPPEGFWAQFEEAGDKLRKTLLIDQHPLIAFYVTCHHPHEYFWPKVVSLDPVTFINDDCFGTKLLHLKDTWKYMVVDFRCWNWKCERCVEWWKSRWKEHLLHLVEAGKMPEDLPVLRFSENDWRYIRDHITKAGGQYLRVMVGTETYRVYATNIPKVLKGSVKFLFDDISNLHAMGFRGGKARIKASKAWALNRRRRLIDWESVRIFWGIDSRRVKQVAEELGAAESFRDAFLLPPEQVVELITRVLGESQNFPGTEEELCPTSTLEGHLSPPPEKKDSPSESPQLERYTGLAHQGQ